MHQGYDPHHNRLVRSNVDHALCRNPQDQTATKNGGAKPPYPIRQYYTQVGEKTKPHIDSHRAAKSNRYRGILLDKRIR